MKAIRFHEFGDANVLRLEDVERPVPGPGEALVRVAASAFNPVDEGIRGGYLQDALPVALPHTPGSDVSGTIEELGAGALGLQIGEAVVGFLPMQADGGSAEYVLAPAEVLTAAPTTIPLADAAALPSVALTAHQSLSENAALTAGQRILINGAGGAVGGFAVQLAKRAGAYVIATASPRSIQRVTTNGADEVIDHTTADVRGAIVEPVDVLLNLARVDAAALSELAERVRPGGVVVNTVPTIPTPSDEKRRVRGIGVFVRSDAGQLARLVELVDRGELRIDIAERVALADLASVHAREAAGALLGKVIVIPTGA